VIHGDRDTLVPVAEARRFTETLRASLRVPVAYAEIPGAQHAFEICPSVRTAAAQRAIQRFCRVVTATPASAQSSRDLREARPPSAAE